MVQRRLLVACLILGLSACGRGGGISDTLGAKDAQKIRDSDIFTFVPAGATVVEGPTVKSYPPRIERTVSFGSNKLDDYVELVNAYITKSGAMPTWVNSLGPNRGIRVPLGVDVVDFNVILPTTGSGPFVENFDFYSKASLKSSDHSSEMHLTDPPLYTVQRAKADLPITGSTGGSSGAGRAIQLTTGSTCNDWLSADTASKKHLIDNLDFSTPIADTSYGVVIPHMDAYCPSHGDQRLSDALYASSLHRPTP